MPTVTDEILHWKVQSIDSMPDMRNKQRYAFISRRRMSRGLRLLITTALGIAAVGAASVGSYELYQAGHQRHSIYQYQPAEHPLWTVAGRSHYVKKAYQPTCDNPQSGADSDICGQWAAVEQASESNRIASINLGLAFLSIAFTFISVLLLVGTLLDTRRTNRRELRAYVFPEAMGITDGSAFPDRPLALNQISSAIIIKNWGQTPAYDVCHWGELTVLPISEEESLIPPNKPIREFGSFIPPGGTINKLRWMPNVLTDEQMRDIEGGNHAIYIYGRIDYRDAFGDHQWMTYRFIWSGKFPIPKDVTMNFAKSGNVSS